MARGNFSSIFRARSVAASNSSTRTALAMNPLPSTAKHCYGPIKFLLDGPDFAWREAVILSHCHRPERTVQIKHSLASATHHMHVRRKVVVWIHGNPKPVKSQNRRHE